MSTEASSGGESGRSLFESVVGNPELKSLGLVSAESRGIGRFRAMIGAKGRGTKDGYRISLNSVDVTYVVFVLPVVQLNLLTGSGCCCGGAVEVAAEEDERLVVS